MESELKRINVRVSKKVKAYFEQKSKDTGVAQSALMALAMEEYIDQKKALETSQNIADIGELLKKLEDVKKD